jgi:hypothetical protein
LIRRRCRTVEVRYRKKAERLKRSAIPPVRKRSSIRRGSDEVRKVSGSEL